MSLAKFRWNDKTDVEFRTDRLMQHLGVSALFLGMLYIIVVFLVWRGVKRVFRETRNWNTLKIFCLSLLIVPLLRAFSFVLHFLIYEGDILGPDTQQFVKDVIMNSLYMIPTFIFMFTYMVLICIWIEITMFSRDQYLIQHDRYNCVWKIVWTTVISLILSALIFIFIWAIVTGNVDFITALYTSLYIMTFVIPLFAFLVYILLVIRFAGFPYLNNVWKQQTVRMFYVVLVWTIGQLISGAMTSIWTLNSGDWMKRDDYIWFSLSVAICLVFSEILPLIYTSDWHRMGFLLMAFVNWRDLWLRNQRSALAHDPRLIDDPRLMGDDNPNNSELEFKPFVNMKPFSSKTKSYHSNYNSLISDTAPSPNSNNDNGPHSRLLSRDEFNTTTTKIFKNKKQIINISDHNYQFNFNRIIIDSNLIIPTYVCLNYTGYYSTHRSTYKAEQKQNENENNNDDNSGDEDDELFCLKVFECESIEKSMLEPIYENLLKFKKLKHDHLGLIYNLDNNVNLRTLRIFSPWYSGGSLYDIITMSPKDTPFAMHVIKRMILQIANFMFWLHDVVKIPHGHLKSRNILFDNEMNVKITDIGLISLKKTMTVFLPNCNFDGYWMDRDYFQGKPIKTQSDVWAFGFILYGLITKKQPFYNLNNDLNEIKKCIVQNNLPQLPQHSPPFLKQLVCKCWNHDRLQRPTFQEIIEMIQKNMS